MNQNKCSAPMAVESVKRLVVAMTLPAGCGAQEEPPTPVVSAAPAKTIQAAVVAVTPTMVPIRVEVTGQVAPIFQATLSSRIQGTIDKLLVREGTNVSKGQLLIQLDSRDLQAELARVNAEVDNAKAHRDRMNQLYAQDAVSKQEMENATRSVHPLSWAGLCCWVRSQRALWYPEKGLSPKGPRLSGLRSRSCSAE